MITVGTQNTQYIIHRRNALIIMVIFVAIITSGCAGTGDWNYQVTEGYYLLRNNSRQICLGYEGSIDGCFSYVIPCYFVTDFCYNSQYIGVSGISTAESFATEEELEREEREYYLVEVATHTVYGPYDKEA